jgi:signal transduction histidine kinase
MTIDDLGRNTAEVAARILNGAAPESITVPAPAARQATFDWRQLRRWGIAESRLPAGSVVRYRSPSLWEEYKLVMLGGMGALVVQSLLIAGLLYQRRARQRAEVDSLRNLALAADASRRQTMSTLTASIAHELGQPLSSMIHNAEALQALVDADRATTGTTTEILTDIRTQGVQAAQIIERHRAMLRSHQLQRKPIDVHAVVHESLALVAHDLKTREIEAAIKLSSSPCVVSGDPVLLQQVLVNLMMNAIDAMAATPKARRRLTVSTAVRAADVELSVRDAGTGLPPHFDGTLSTPFVTTKPHGLGIGLTIARTIVDAHGGTIAARNNPEGGATLTITLHRSKMPESLSASQGAA